MAGPAGDEFTVAKTVSEASSYDSDLAKQFGSILSISDDALTKLASRFRQQQVTTETSIPAIPACVVVSRFEGAYNRVHVLRFEDGIKYVIRVPCFGWGNHWQREDATSLRSQALTMQFIKRKTGIPMPEVYDYDTTFHNVIGAPYILMSFVEGRQINQVWEDDSGATSREDKLQRIMSTTAEAMCHLQNLHFDKLGTLYFETETTQNPQVGSMPAWDEGELLDVNAERRFMGMVGPFDTSQDFLKYQLRRFDKVKKLIPYQLGVGKLLSLLIDYLPFSSKSTAATDPPETFVLSPPDFNFRNVLVDESGKLTGILDWDNVRTVPRYAGWASYPPWLMMDWQPFWGEGDGKDSAADYERHRRFYAEKIGQLLHGSGDYKYTLKSHLFNSIVSACGDSMSDSFVVQRILKIVLGDEYDYDYEERIGKGNWDSEKEAMLREKVRELLAV
ncbi:MAG: hypothetical protein M1830_008204 [Pleopsidium flavum]|nr:MAG: hypothetical protein M1830_008204 [Pleopsidium flavum]